MWYERKYLKICVEMRRDNYMVVNDGACDNVAGNDNGEGR